MIKKSSLSIVIIAFLFCYGILFYINHTVNKAEQEKRQILLEENHKEAAFKFKKSINEFALISSSIRAYTQMLDQEPTAQQLQSFVKNQMKDLNFDNDLIISFIDSNHIFQYSFDSQKVFNNHLKGTSLSTFRDSLEINQINKVLSTDILKIFPPINLVEGWAGIPMNFRLKVNDQVIGYLAAIIRIETIIDDIIQPENSSDYAFHFSTQGGTSFDRYAIYNDTKIYNSYEDPEYYERLNLQASNFTYSEITLYDFGFKIGTTNKIPYRPNSYFSFLFWAGLVLLTFSFILTIIGFYYYTNLNNKIQLKNEKLLRKNNELHLITQKKEELNKVNNELFTIISKDLRAPLSSVQTYLKIIELDEKYQFQNDEFFLDIQKAIKGTDKILEDLSNWSKIQTTTPTIQLEKINISKLVFDVYAFQKGDADRKQIDITTDFADDIYVYGDDKMIAVILRNLISNAVKYSLINSTIELIIEEIGQEVLISVKDEGIGMSKEMLNNIFHPNEKVIRLGTNKEKGLGLGLHICKEFIGHMKGKLTVSSSTNNGSTFTFNLPKTNPAVANIKQGQLNNFL